MDYIIVYSPTPHIYIYSVLLVSISVHIYVYPYVCVCAVKKKCIAHINKYIFFCLAQLCVFVNCVHVNGFSCVSQSSGILGASGRILPMLKDFSFYFFFMFDFCIDA